MRSSEKFPQYLSNSLIGQLSVWLSPSLYNNWGSLIPQDMVELWYMTKKVSINWPGYGW